MRKPLRIFYFIFSSSFTLISIHLQIVPVRNRQSHNIVLITNMTLRVFFLVVGGGGESRYIVYSSRNGGHYAIYVMIYASWNRLLMANTYLYDVTNNERMVFKQTSNDLKITCTAYLKN